MSVSARVLEHGGSEAAAIAALLHDAVDDAEPGEGPQVLADIKERFGQPVADIVRSCSDGLNEAGNRSGSWLQRKIANVEALPQKTAGAALVTAADRTHNARCITADVGVYAHAAVAVVGRPGALRGRGGRVERYNNTRLEGAVARRLGVRFAPRSRAGESGKRVVRAR